MIVHNKGRETNKQLLCIFKGSLHSMRMKTQIIRQVPATLEEAAKIAMTEPSILLQIRCESSYKAMKVDHHTQSINIQVLNRHRDKGQNRI